MYFVLQFICAKFVSVTLQWLKCFQFPPKLLVVDSCLNPFSPTFFWLWQNWDYQSIQSWPPECPHVKQEALLLQRNRTTSRGSSAIAKPLVLIIVLILVNENISFLFESLSCFRYHNYSTSQLQVTTTSTSVSLSTSHTKKHHESTQAPVAVTRWMLALSAKLCFRYSRQCRQDKNAVDFYFVLVSSW